LGNVLAEIARRLWQAYSAIPWLGAFIVSLLGNAVPYTTVPYLLWIALTAPGYRDPVTKALIIVFAGLGAALGKLIVFSVGRAAHQVLPESVRANMEVFARLFEKWGFLAIFLFAASPLPDDILYIPLGVAGYNPLLFFVAVALGKIVITAVAVAFGDILAMAMGGGTSPEFIAAMIVISIIITIVIARIDWMRVADAARKHGVLTAMGVLLEEVVYALLPRGRRGEAYGARG